MSDKVNSRLDYVLELIEEKGLTAYEIAKNTSLTSAGIQKIIDGKTKKPSVNTLNIILKYLNGEVEHHSPKKYFFDEDAENKKKEAEFDSLPINKQLSLMYKNQLELDKKFDRLFQYITDLADPVYEYMEQKK